MMLKMSIFHQPVKILGRYVMGKEILKDGEQVEIVFHTEAVDKHWDIYVTWPGYESDEDVCGLIFNLTKISEISLFYDAETEKTWQSPNRLFFFLLDLIYPSFGLIL
ncbi:MAG: hypothetical protein IPI50_12635 [Saprospiraceae bacterium]|nr:hypothetical protein [Saprospiraceae bacterium]